MARHGNARPATRWAAATLLAVTAAGATQAGGLAFGAPIQAESAPAGLTLDKDRHTITSALRVDLTRDFATLPLFKGTAGGKTVWYVITDTSDATMARELGINHAPKLLNAPEMCPACVQEVESDEKLLGKAPVAFQGAPDFSPTRTVEPAPKPFTFPPQTFTVGAEAGPNYSPYVRVKGSDAVFNAPIVATGDAPSDVTTHADTHDRLLGYDTEKMTADLLFVRGFAGGRSIAYLSFDSSDAFTATVERSTFVPALADLGFQNGGDGPGGRKDQADSARASIFTFVNAATGLEDSPPDTGASQGKGRSQGLTHALSLPIVGQDAAVDNAAVLDGLRRGADVSNIFSDMPRTFGSSNRAQYSPAWDLQVGVYTPDAVSKRANGLKTDITQVRRQVANGEVTGPGGLPLGSANIIINCPALAFLDDSAGTAISESSVDADAGAGSVDQASITVGAINAGFGGQGAAQGPLPVLPALLLVTGAGIAVVVAGRRIVRH